MTDVASNTRELQCATILRRDVWTCTRCKESCFVRLEDGSGFKFPPTIGATGEAILLFVGINPRISATNSALHERIMEDFGAFEELSANRVEGLPYVRRGGETHYRAHLDVVESLFPGRRFEEVAAVTELYLCASEKAPRLPEGVSPCVARFWLRTLDQVRPLVIVAVGRTVEDYLRRGREPHDFTVPHGKNLIPLVTIPHPNARLERGERARQMERAVGEIREILEIEQVDLPECPPESEPAAGESLMLTVMSWMLVAAGLVLLCFMVAGLFVALWPVILLIVVCFLLWRFWRK